MILKEQKVLKGKGLHYNEQLMANNHLPRCQNPIVCLILPSELM